MVRRGAGSRRRSRDGAANRGGILLGFLVSLLIIAGFQSHDFSKSALDRATKRLDQASCRRKAIRHGRRRRGTIVRFTAPDAAVPSFLPFDKLADTTLRDTPVVVLLRQEMTNLWRVQLFILDDSK